jgi:hypothetical protein
MHPLLFSLSSLSFSQFYLSRFDEPPPPGVTMTGSRTLARAKGKVISPNGETIGIELDETIVVKHLFHQCEILLLLQALRSGIRSITLKTIRPVGKLMSFSVCRDSASPNFVGKADCTWFSSLAEYDALFTISHPF